MSLGKLLHLSVPQFTHLYMGDDVSWGLNDVICIKNLTQCLDLDDSSPC